MYKSLVEHSNALKSLKREYDKLKEDEKALSDILSQLRTGFNPNYQDMAVLEAVRGFEYYAGLPHINERDDDKGESEAGSEAAEGQSAEEPPAEEEKLEEGMWSKERLDRELNALMWTDHTNLLLQHDSHVNTEKTPSSLREFIHSLGRPVMLRSHLVFDLNAYIPEALAPQYEALKEILVSWLELFGIAHAPKQDSATGERFNLHIL
jgi:protein kinase C substrate 80K-H